MKKKYTIAVLILILLFSCGKKDKKSQNSQSRPNIENRQDDKLKELIKKLKREIYRHKLNLEKCIFTEME